MKILLKYTRSLRRLVELCPDIRANPLSSPAFLLISSVLMAEGRDPQRGTVGGLPTPSTMANLDLVSCRAFRAGPHGHRIRYPKRRSSCFKILHKGS